MKIVVDTNIIFSGLLNTNGKIAEILITTKRPIEFYSCSYMRYEIQKHWTKLKKISKLSDKQLQEAQYNLFSRLTFIDERLIPSTIWERAIKLSSQIDEDDTDFIALTIHLKGFLWTGDKELYNGLKEKKFKRVYNMADLTALLELQ